LKILVIVPSYMPAFVYGGPIRAIATLCESLVVRGHQVTVYTTNANGQEDLEVALDTPHTLNEVTVFYHKRWTKDHTNFSPALLKRLMKTASGFDIIHIHSWWNLVCVPAAQICFWKNKRPVISLRGTMTQFSVAHKNTSAKRWIHALMGKRLLNRAVLHSTSRKEDERLQAFVDNNDRYIIPNILELPDPYPRPATPDQLTIVYLGRIDPAKNIEMLLRTVQLPFDFAIQLNIIGEGPEDYVQQLKEQTTAYCINWKGNMDGSDKWRALVAADLLVLPSHIENYGNVVPEALSQGTAVLIADEVGSRDLVEANDLGWVVPANEALWQQALNDIWHDKAKRDRIRKEAPAIVKQVLSKDLLVQDYLEMYASMSTPQKKRRLNSVPATA
jgi:glycosyltransferase involved in cell wall biosynthesis